MQSLVFQIPSHTPPGLLSSSGRETYPPGDTQGPQRDPLLVLEVRIRGCWDSWVRVPAHRQSLSSRLTLLESKGVQPARQAFGAQPGATLRVHTIVLAKGSELLLGAEREASDAGFQGAGVAPRLLFGPLETSL